MKVLAIAGNSLRRLVRDRTNIFFVFLMPLLLILVLGSAFGGSYAPRVGLVVLRDTELTQGLSQRFSSIDGLDVQRYSDRGSLTLAVERGRLEAGVVIPANFDELLRSGKSSAVEFMARPGSSSLALRNTISAAVAEEGLTLRAAQFAMDQSGSSFDSALTAARVAEKQARGVSVDQSVIGKPFALDSLGRFDLGAYSQLLLFIFLTSTTGSTALIQSRQLGVLPRMVATPTKVSTILAGELLGRFAVAIFQGLIIMLGTWAVFGVNWGDPVGAAATFVLFALGAAGVGMLMGATFKNDQQAGAIGVVMGIGLGALGGAMMPLAYMKIFSPTLYKVAHLTPHAWGIEAFQDLIIYGKSAADILPQLGVLAGFAAVMIALGTWRLRVALTRAR